MQSAKPSKIISKSNKSTQTKLRVYPINLHSNAAEVFVVVDQRCQTAASLKPNSSIELVIALLEFVPYQEIQKNSIRVSDLPRKALIQFNLPLSSSLISIATLDSYSRSSSVIVVKKASSHTLTGVKSYKRLTIMPTKAPTSDTEAQTDLRVAPHILEENEVATVYTEIKTQTSLTFNPDASKTKIVVLLQENFPHPPGEEKLVSTIENVPLTGQPLSHKSEEQLPNQPIEQVHARISSLVDGTVEMLGSRLKEILKIYNTTEHTDTDLKKKFGERTPVEEEMARRVMPTTEILPDNYLMQDHNRRQSDKITKKTKDEPGKPDPSVCICKNDDPELDEVFKMCECIVNSVVDTCECDEKGDEEKDKDSCICGGAEEPPPPPPKTKDKDKCECYLPVEEPEPPKPPEEPPPSETPVTDKSCLCPGNAEETTEEPEPPPPEPEPEPPPEEQQPVVQKKSCFCNLPPDKRAEMEKKYGQKAEEKPAEVQPAADDQSPPATEPTPIESLPQEPEVPEKEEKPPESLEKPLVQKKSCFCNLTPELKAEIEAKQRRKEASEAKAEETQIKVEDTEVKVEDTEVKQEGQEVTKPEEPEMKPADDKKQLVAKKSCLCNLTPEEKAAREQKEAEKPSEQEETKPEEPEVKPVETPIEEEKPDDKQLVAKISCLCNLTPEEKAARKSGKPSEKEGQSEAGRKSEAEPKTEGEGKSETEQKSEKQPEEEPKAEAEPQPAGEKPPEETTPKPSDHGKQNPCNCCSCLKEQAQQKKQEEAEARKKAAELKKAELIKAAESKPPKKEITCICGYEAVTCENCAECKYPDIPEEDDDVCICGAVELEGIRITRKDGLFHEEICECCETCNFPEERQVGEDAPCVCDQIELICECCEICEKPQKREGQEEGPCICDEGEALLAETVKDEATPEAGGDKLVACDCNNVTTSGAEPCVCPEEVKIEPCGCNVPPEVKDPCVCPQPGELDYLPCVCPAEAPKDAPCECPDEKEEEVLDYLPCVCAEDKGKDPCECPEDYIPCVCGEGTGECICDETPPEEVPSVPCLCASNVPQEGITGVQSCECPEEPPEEVIEPCDCPQNPKPVEVPGEPNLITCECPEEVEPILAPGSCVCKPGQGVEEAEEVPQEPPKPVELPPDSCVCIGGKKPKKLKEIAQDAVPEGGEVQPAAEQAVEEGASAGTRAGSTSAPEAEPPVERPSRVSKAEEVAAEKSDGAEESSGEPPSVEPPSAETPAAETSPQESPAPIDTSNEAPMNLTVPPCPCGPPCVQCSGDIPCQCVKFVPISKKLKPVDQTARPSTYDPTKPQPEGTKFIPCICADDKKEVPCECPIDGVEAPPTIYIPCSCPGEEIPPPPPLDFDPCDCGEVKPAQPEPCVCPEEEEEPVAIPGECVCPEGGQEVVGDFNPCACEPGEEPKPEEEPTPEEPPPEEIIPPPDEFNPCVCGDQKVSEECLCPVPPPPPEITPCECADDEDYIVPCECAAPPEPQICLCVPQICTCKKDPCVCKEGQEPPPPEVPPPAPGKANACICTDPEPPPPPPEPKTKDVCICTDEKPPEPEEPKTKDACICTGEEEPLPPPPPPKPEQKSVCTCTEETPPTEELGKEEVKESPLDTELVCDCPPSCLNPVEPPPNPDQICTCNEVEKDEPPPPKVDVCTCTPPPPPKQICSCKDQEFVYKPPPPPPPPPPQKDPEPCKCNDEEKPPERNPCVCPPDICPVRPLDADCNCLGVQAPPKEKDEKITLIKVQHEICECPEPEEKAPIAELCECPTESGAEEKAGVDVDFKVCVCPESPPPEEDVCICPEPPPPEEDICICPPPEEEDPCPIPKPRKKKVDKACECPDPEPPPKEGPQVCACTGEPVTIKNPSITELYSREKELKRRAEEKAKKENICPTTQWVCGCGGENPSGLASKGICACDEVMPSTKEQICACKEELPPPPPPAPLKKEICICDKETSPPPPPPKENICTCDKETSPPPPPPRENVKDEEICPATQLTCTCIEVEASSPAPKIVQSEGPKEEKKICAATQLICDCEDTPTPPPPVKEVCTCAANAAQPPPPQDDVCSCEEEPPPPPKQEICTCKEEEPPPPPIPEEICPATQLTCTCIEVETSTPAPKIVQAEGPKEEKKICAATQLICDCEDTTTPPPPVKEVCTCAANAAQPPPPQDDVCSCEEELPPPPPKEEICTCKEEEPPPPPIPEEICVCPEDKKTPPVIEDAAPVVEERPPAVIVCECKGEAKKFTTPPTEDICDCPPECLDREKGLDVKKTDNGICICLDQPEPSKFSPARLPFECKDPEETKKQSTQKHCRICGMEMKSKRRGRKRSHDESEGITGKRMDGVKKPEITRGIKIHICAANKR